MKTRTRGVARRVLARGAWVVGAVLLTAAHRESPPPAVTSPMTVPAESDTLRLTLEVPREVAADEAVPITLRLTNTSARTIQLHLLGREIVFDLAVTGRDGSLVWQRLAEQSVVQILRLETMLAGATLELSERWDQRDNGGGQVGSGTYTIVGILPTDGEPLRTPPATVTIVDR